MTANITEVMWMLGRALLGAYYAWAGIHHFTGLAPIAAAMTARRVPAARAVLIVGSIFQTACGLALVFGLWPACAALGLVLFTIVASIMFLDFWNKEGEARAGAVSTWKTNLALSGGLLIAAAYSF